MHVNFSALCYSAHPSIFVLAFELQQIQNATYIKMREVKCEERENQQDATVRCLLSTSVSTCFGHHYAHLQENKDRVTAYGVTAYGVTAL